ncbi:MAG: hypothetical protein ACLTUZ_03145 [Sellimonas intestinalis]|uniref:hypothetical protein n=1 Tax=Sellimonas intestinalis TaxID=1653434 RepID=UPI003994B586
MSDKQKLIGYTKSKGLQYVLLHIKKIYFINENLYISKLKLYSEVWHNHRLFYGQWQDTVLESMIIFNTTFIGEERLIGKISL